MNKPTEPQITNLIELVKGIISERVIKRIFCVLLLICEIDKAIISDKLGLSMKSIKKYEEIFFRGNIRDLIPDNSNRRKSELENYKDEIFAELDKNTYKTLREISIMVEKLTGLKRDRSRIGKFLKKTGFVPSK